MELSIHEQIFEQIRKSNKILIALPQNLLPDALTSALGLRLFLNKLQKDVSVISFGQAPENLKFLPGADALQNSISAKKSLVITIDTSLKKLEEISYQTSEQKAQVFLKAKNEEFVPGDVSFASEKFPVDLIFVIGAKSLEDLGKLYEQNTDLFFETPKINIDNHPGNEFFGQINLVDIAVSSTAELLADLLQKYEQQLLDEDIATCLLLGIIFETQSFQHVQTTPKAFLKASELVGLGARQQEIIKNIYKTKSLPMLKLWGRILARLTVRGELSLAYSLLNLGDFEKSQSGPDDILPAFKELVDSLSGYKFMAIFSETQSSSVRVVLAIHLSAPMEQISQQLELPGKPVLELSQYKIYDFEISQSSLPAAEKYFLEALEPQKQSLQTSA